VVFSLTAGLLDIMESSTPKPPQPLRQKGAPAAMRRHHKGWLDIYFDREKDPVGRKEVKKADFETINDGKTQKLKTQGLDDLYSFILDTVYNLQLVKPAMYPPLTVYLWKAGSHESTPLGVETWKQVWQAIEDNPHCTACLQIPSSVNPHCDNIRLSVQRTETSIVKKDVMLDVRRSDLRKAESYYILLKHFNLFDVPDEKQKQMFIRKLAHKPDPSSFGILCLKAYEEDCCPVAIKVGPGKVPKNAPQPSLRYDGMCTFRSWRGEIEKSFDGTSHRLALAIAEFIDNFLSAVQTVNLPTVDPAGLAGRKHWFVCKIVAPNGNLLDPKACISIMDNVTGMTCETLGRWHCPLDHACGVHSHSAPLRPLNFLMTLHHVGYP